MAKCCALLSKRKKERARERESETYRRWNWREELQFAKRKGSDRRGRGRQNYDMNEHITGQDRTGQESPLFRITHPPTPSYFPLFFFQFSSFFFFFKEKKKEKRMLFWFFPLIICFTFTSILIFIQRREVEMENDICRFFFVNS